LCSLIAKITAADFDVHIGSPIDIVPTELQQLQDAKVEAQVKSPKQPTPQKLRATAGPSLLSPSRSHLNKHKQAITCGKFANMLSCCLFHKIELTQEEFGAIEELLEASNDNSHQYYITNNYEAYNFHANTTPNSPNSGGSSNGGGDIFTGLQAVGQKYWAKRLFEFVSKVVEIKSWQKDEDTLYEFGLFTGSSGTSWDD
jgi:hypothetical protein